MEYLQFKKQSEEYFRVFFRVFGIVMTIDAYEFDDHCFNNNISKVEINLDLERSDGSIVRSSVKKENIDVDSLCRELCFVAIGLSHSAFDLVGISKLAHTPKGLGFEEINFKQKLKEIKEGIGELIK